MSSGQFGRFGFIGKRVSSSFVLSYAAFASARLSLVENWF